MTSNDARTLQVSIQKAISKLLPDGMASASSFTIDPADGTIQLKVAICQIRDDGSVILEV